MQQPSSQLQSTSLLPELRASHSPSWENERAWTTSVVNWHWALGESFAKLTHDGSSGKTCPEFSPATEEGISVPSSGRWANSGFTVPGGCWTLATSECPRGGVASTLSDILETGAHQQRCCLTSSHAKRLQERLSKYRKNQNPEVVRLLAVHGSECQETRPQSTNLESLQP